MLALGATLGRGLDIPGNDADGVLRAIEFLINVNQGFKANIGERVVVIGAATSPWTPPVRHCGRRHTASDRPPVWTFRRVRTR